jgi:hypothetical protein
MTGLTQYRIYDPRDLAPELQSRRWRHLCEQLDHYENLAPVAQLRVPKLLGKLGLYPFVLELVPPPTGGRVRASSRTHFDGGCFGYRDGSAVLGVSS